MMGIFIRLVLSLCLLFVVFSVFRSHLNTADNRASTRIARAAGTPIPINCKLGRWSSWTACNSCTDKKLRFRRLEKPSQFGGEQCIETLWEKQACPETVIPCFVPDYCGEKFTCNSTGRCISQSLVCNDVRECDDFSDENKCEETHPREDYCSSLLSIPGARDGVQGYNILTDEFLHPVLDPNYYGESCEYVYNGEWRKFTYDAFCEKLHYNEDEKNFRKPYNYHTYQFAAEAASEGSHEYYEDMASLLNARKTEGSANFGVSVGVAYVEVGLSGKVESEFLKNVTKYKSQDLGFVRLFSKIQTALFKIRTSNLMLHEDFLMDLMDLPEQYDYGMYSRFINTYGTHYVTQGTMGGTLEYVVVINKTKTAKSELTSELIGGCFGASIGLAAPLKGAGELGLKVDGEMCGKEGGGGRETKTHSADVKDVVSLVKGGVTVTAGGVLVIKDPDTYRKWGASLKYHPVLIDYEVMPIYELVRLSTDADYVGSRLANLQRGFDEYLQEFDPCRCSPCMHKGIPIFSGTSCKCECRSGYEGVACEKTRRTDLRTDGAWSCWGPWTSCTSGRKTRSRNCNNPPPSGGGETCLGSASQTRLC